MHRAEEDFIKNLYKLTIEANQELVKNTKLAEALGLSDQSINETVKRLEAKKIIAFVPYKGVSLTKKGLKEALRLVRNHRLWEVFLVKYLKISWIHVHQEAEKLEHASSELLIDHLDQFLNYPQTCVHGNPIPPKTDSPPLNISYTPLNEVLVGQTFLIKKVADYQPLLVFFDEHHLRLNQVITITSIDPFNQIITFKAEQSSISVATPIAQMIEGTTLSD